jgi:predicted nucleotidyltransferase
MNIFDELFEYTKEDEKIVNSFKPKSILCPVIFNGTIMEKKIRERLLEISNEFIESFGVEFFIHDVVLTGSLSNYNWSKYSDVDLHIIIDMSELGDESKLTQKIIKEFFDSKKNIWNNNHEIKIKGFDVEVYVQDLNEPHVSSGVYSILHDKWIVIPKKETPKIDKRKIFEKGEEFAKKIDNLVSLGPKTENLVKIEELRKRIKKFRQSGLESGGEFSYENLTFKLLRRNGYIEKLIELKNKITDKKLSITQ